MISYQAENASEFVGSFAWGDPIYGRVYFEKGLNNEYADAGWKADGYYYSFKEIYLNDNLMYSYWEKEKPNYTTRPMCFSVNSEDTYIWSDMKVLASYLEIFNPGDNKITVKYYAYNYATEVKGKLLGTGSFTISVPAQEITKAKQTTFVWAKVKDQYADYLWGQYVMGVVDKESQLYTKTVGDANNWYFYYGVKTAEIFTTTKGNFNQFKLVSGDYTVTMTAGSENGFQTWTVNDGSKTIKVTTSKIDYSTDHYAAGTWREWLLSGDAGTMSVAVTSNSMENAWMDWVINDEMPNEKGMLKMAAVFCCIISSLP